MLKNTLQESDIISVQMPTGVTFQKLLFYSYIMLY